MFDKIQVLDRGHTYGNPRQLWLAKTGHIVITVTTTQFSIHFHLLFHHLDFIEVCNTKIGQRSNAFLKA